MLVFKNGKIFAKKIKNFKSNENFARKLKNLTEI